MKAKAKIDITIDEIIDALILSQRNFNQGFLKAKSSTEVQAAASSSFSGFHDEIGMTSDLNREHVEGLLRTLVASRNHLMENVAVFPVVHLTAIVNQARDVAYKKIITDEAYKDLIPSNEPLPERKDCNKEELAKRDAEEKKRAKQERELNQNEAIRVLGDNEYTLSKLVQCFLEAMIKEPDNFLGNPHKKDLSFAGSKQFIIPMRTSENYSNWSDTHYDVAVVNCNSELKTAEITYYDSLGWPIAPLYQRAIEDLFQDKGFRTTFKDVAKRDQNDSYNCGIFAALGAIEIASQNVGVAESLIQNIVQDNHKKALNEFRYLLGHSLIELGYNIKVEDSLDQSMSASQKGVDYLREFAKLLDSITTEIQKISELSSVSPEPIYKDFSPLDIDLIFKKCDELRSEIEKILKQKLRMENSEPQDEEHLRFLLSTLLAINLASEEYKAKINAPSESLSFLSSLYQKFTHLSRTKKIIYGSLVLGASVLGSAYTVALFIKLAALLPANPWLLVGISALGIVSVLEGRKIFADSSSPSPAEKEAEINLAADQATMATLLAVSESLEMERVIEVAAESAPVEAVTPAPVEVATPAPVEAAESAPVEAAESAPVEAVTPAPVEVAEPAPVEAATTPAPVEVAEPAPVEVAEPAPVEVAEPAPVEVAEPAPVEVAEPAPVEVAEPAPIQALADPVSVGAAPPAMTIAFKPPLNSRRKNASKSVGNFEPTRRSSRKR